MNTIILASSSAYRRALLSRLRIPFETLASGVDETRRAGESGSEMVTRLAQLKAQAVGARRANALIIGCDQCAVHDGTILGKPGNFENAFRQLREVAGDSVRFHTGLCLLNGASGESQVDIVSIDVRFRSLSDDQIRFYLRKEAPYQCAGSFMSEGLGIALVERIDGGDPTALIGLPLIRLVTMLAHEGVRAI